MHGWQGENLIREMHKLDITTWCKVEPSAENMVQSSMHNLFSLLVNPALSYFVTIDVQGAPLCLLFGTGAALGFLKKDT